MTGFYCQNSIFCEKLRCWNKRKIYSRIGNSFAKKLGQSFPHTRRLFCVCFWRILVGFNTFSWIFLVEKVEGTITKNMFKSLKWKIMFFLQANFFFKLLPGKDWLGQKFMEQKKYLKITKFVGIYLKLKSGALQKGYEFLSWAQKCQKENGQQNFRTTS